MAGITGAAGTQHLAGLVDRVGELLLARPAIAALGLGLLAAATLPPVHALPLLLAFAGLVWLLLAAPTPWRAAARGWCFGFGYFLGGLWWVAVAFFVEAERFGALALPAVLLLAAGLALFPAAAALLVALRRWHSPVAAALAFAVAWTASELLRGEIGRFPWNLAGTALALSEVTLQPAALVGAYGLTLLVVTAGAVPVALLATPRHRLAPVLAILLVPALALWGSVRLAGTAPGDVDGLRLRVVQANIPQELKWEPELVDRWFDRHLRLSAEGAEDVTHVIWPESATPYQLERDEVARELIAAVVPDGGLVLTGAEHFDRGAAGELIAHNSLFAVDGAGLLLDRHDKVDLVPFGEFLPARALLERLGLGTLTRGTFDFRPGPGRRTVDLDGLPPFSPLICYEVIFPGGVTAAARPGWLLNVTNDAWFGRSSGPFQHLAMARMRAVEEGLPLVRAANTGISTVIDARGRIRHRLGLGETGVIDTALPAPLPPTPFARFGHYVALGLALAWAAAIAGMELHKKRWPDRPQRR